jgi:hypothetical protein
MWRELFTGSPATTLAIAALLFFIAAFGGMLVWTARRKRSDHYRRMARLPMEDAAEGQP